MRDNGSEPIGLHVSAYGARVNAEYADAYCSTAVDKIDLHIPQELLDREVEHGDAGVGAKPGHPDVPIKVGPGMVGEDLGDMMGGQDIVQDMDIS